MPYRAVVLGTGSLRSHALLAAARGILEQRTADFTIYLEDDAMSIATYDVEITPALLLNGVVLYAQASELDLDLLERNIKTFLDKTAF